MYSTFNCSIAASTSAERTFANSLGENSSSAPAPWRTSTISLVESGFCALKRSASITRVRVILVCTDRGLDGVSDAIGVFVDLIELAPLDQKPDLRFGAGVSQKDATFAGELAFYFLAQFHNLVQVLDRRFRFNREIALRLRIFFETLFQFAEWLPGRVHDPQDLEGADDAVASRREIAKDDVAALFAAEIQISRYHFFNHVTVAHFCANDFAVGGIDSFVETEIAHHGRDQRVGFQLRIFQEIDRGDGENLIAIDNLALLVAKQDAIGVAIMGDTDVRAGFFHDALNFFRVRTAA